MRRMLMNLTAAAALFGMTALTQAQVDLSTERGDSRPVVYGKLMNTYLTADFNENDLRDVVKFLSELGDIDILVKWADDATFGEGLDPTAKVTLALTNETRLATIIDLVLEQATEEETSWSLGDGFVVLGTKESLNNDKYVAIYPVRELLFVAPTFDSAPELDLQAVLSGGQTGEISQNIFDDEEEDDQERVNEEDQADELIDIITTLVDQFQWERNGGEGGSIRYFRGNLIINASDYLHRQVAGYPFSPAVVRTGSQASISGPRYVTLTGRFGTSRLLDIDQFEVPILVGGQVISSGGGGGGRPGG
ncbi:MAG: hypothetical protein ACF8PN_14710 [Phycisphaerales bacterium]